MTGQNIKKTGTQRTPKVAHMSFIASLKDRSIQELKAPGAIY